MDHLPFLVVHGAVVWCAALVLLVGGPLFRVWWLPRRAARARRRRTLEQWGPSASPAVELDGQTITLTGRLAADGSCGRFDDGRDAAAVSAELSPDTAISDRAARLWLEVGRDRVRVELEGDVPIATGSRETWPDRPFEELSLPVQARVLGHGVAPHLRQGRPGFRSLRAGDAVVARGVLVVVGTAAETDYREPAHRFVLRSAALASDVPPRVRGLARSHLVLPTLAGGALFLCLFGAGGAALDRCSKHADGGGGSGSLEEVLRGQGAAVLMAATPFHRASALERLGRLVESRGAPSLEVREAIVALSDLRGDCAGAIEALMRHRQFRRALERGDSCDDRRGRLLAARAAFLAGELEVASNYLAGDRDEDEVDDSEMALRVHLLAGNGARAARVARQLALRHRTSELGHTRQAVAWTAHDWSRSRELDCMADAIEARAGDAASMARLQRAARPPEQRGCVVTVPPNVECRLLYLDLRRGRERTDPLGGVLSAFGEWTETALFLSIDSDPGRWPGPHLLLSSGIFDAARGPMDELSRFGLGLDRSALSALVTVKKLEPWSEPIRPLLLARSALEESMLLRHDEARRLIAVAARDVGGGAYGLPDLAPLRAMVELRAGDLAAASRALEDVRPQPAASDGSSGHVAGLVAALRRREPPPGYFDGFVSRDDLAAALQGDGRALAADLAEHHDQPAMVDSLALVARWLPRAPLARYLRFGRWTYKADLLGLDSALTSLSNLALMAEAVGDRELAQELAGGLRRLREASQRRDIAIPLAILERFPSPTPPE